MKKLVAAVANSAVVTKSPNRFSNDVFLANFHLEFTSEPPATPRPNDDKSLAAQKNEISEEMGFSMIIVALFIIGLLVNIGCLLSLRGQSTQSIFHKFLKMLACFDALVVSCIFLMYALPVLAPWYKKTIFLPAIPFFLPLVHMALMGSVYSTIIMSLERYMRLCRVQNMSVKYATIYCGIVVVFPMVFYFPKFFEYKYQKFEHDFPTPINCTQYVMEQRELVQIDETLKMSADVVVSGGRIRHYNHKKPQKRVVDPTHPHHPAPSLLYNYPSKCLDYDFDLYNTSDDFIRTLTERKTVYYPNATEIRRNPYYYTIYCVALNTCFATLLPLMALIYLNCMTLRALRRLGKQTNGVPTTQVYSHSQPLDVIMEEVDSSSTSSPEFQGQDKPTVRFEGLDSLSSRPAEEELDQKETIVQNNDNLYQKKESRLTRISISIVWLFIVCHVWKLVPTIYELIYSEDGLELPSWPSWLVTIKHLSHTLIAFNSAVNFLIYALI